MGGGPASLAIVMAIALSACVSAPAKPPLRVLPGGLAGPVTPPTPVPTQSTRPEPPIGVIFSGRVVLPCERNRCTSIARLVPVAVDPAHVASTTLDPDDTPVPLAGVPAAQAPIDLLPDDPVPGAATAGEPAAGRSVLDAEPGSTIRVLQPGTWRVEVYAARIDALKARAWPLADRAHLACAHDVTVLPGQAVAVDVAFAHVGALGCSIDVSRSWSFAR